jgi:hypothetical protein
MSDADLADLVAVAPERSSAEVDVFGAGLRGAASSSTAGTGFDFNLALALVFDCFDMDVTEVTVAFDSCPSSSFLLGGVMPLSGARL